MVIIYYEWSSRRILYYGCSDSMCGFIADYRCMCCFTIYIYIYIYIYVCVSVCLPACMHARNASLSRREVKTKYGFGIGDSA